MSETTRVALDAMGGDNAPQRDRKGSGKCRKISEKTLKCLLAGKEEVY